MKILIAADTHLYAPKATHPSVLSLCQEIDNTAWRHNIPMAHIYLGGDIVDLKNTRKKLINDARAAVELLKSQYNYILGNHEGRFVGRYDCQVNDNIFIEHGHRLFWDEKKAKRWEDTPFEGISDCRWLAMCVADEIDELFLRNSSKLSKEIKERIANRYSGYKTVIVGHKHPKKLINERINGINFYCVPRGITVLEV
jgi:predicted phosphodiesterase